MVYLVAKCFTKNRLVLELLRDHWKYFDHHFLVFDHVPWKSRSSMPQCASLSCQLEPMRLRSLSLISVYVKRKRAGVSQGIQPDLLVTAWSLLDDGLPRARCFHILDRRKILSNSLELFPQLAHPSISGLLDVSKHLLILLDESLADFHSWEKPWCCGCSLHQLHLDPLLGPHGLEEDSIPFLQFFLFLLLLSLSHSVELPVFHLSAHSTRLLIKLLADNLLLLHDIRKK